MADAVTTQILLDSVRNTVMKFTNISDGTGEAAVNKVIIANLNPVPSGVKIMRIKGETVGMGLDILWDATADLIGLSLAQDRNIDLDFTKFGGLINNAGAGKTGNIAFTTVGHSAGDRYSVILEMVKKYTP